ncbi:MAG: tRNA (adenosine(37)-N6)-dimethylallyltransferase MiaA [Siphonobacter sp.]
MDAFSETERNFNAIVVLGPTASGKTSLAVSLATELGGEIISVDSRQIYKGMDIGTGKDLEEYGEVPHHLIDIREAGEQYNVHQYQLDFQRVFEELEARHSLPILCGGTGLYLEAVLKKHQYTGIPVNENLRNELAMLTDEQLQKRFHESTSSYHSLADLSTRKRTIRALEMAEYLRNNVLQTVPAAQVNPLVLGINPSVEVRRKRISTRLRKRLQEGFIEEVQRLLTRGIPADKLIYYGLEYKFITEYLQGHWDLPTMIARLEVAIHQFAKRQMTFFRKLERDGVPIHWLEGEPDEIKKQAFELAKQALKR